MRNSVHAELVEAFFAHFPEARLRLHVNCADGIIVPKRGEVFDRRHASIVFYLKTPSLSSLRTRRSSTKSSALSLANLASMRLKMRTVLRTPSTVGKMRLL